MSTTSKLYTFNELMTSGIVSVQDGKEMRRRVERIVIPMIQRPYAQGRKSQKGIRDNFLKDIFTALEDQDTSKLELNFVYGTFTGSESGSFELLDGQQRLTTLFLLHWYIAKREQMEDATATLPEYLDRFEYQTRTTSTLFLRKLYNARIAADELPSHTLRKAAWYSRSFDKDSTVDAMLRMLDAIHEKYNSAAVKPTYQDLEKLQFYVLELNGFGLSEELFIKMNARGLQLTPFENFKADLVGYMKTRYADTVQMTLSNLERSVPCWLNFSSLIDGKWTNLFWERHTDGDNSGGKECDMKFFRFVQRFFACKSVLLADKQTDSGIANDPLYLFFTKNVEVERHLGFEPYADMIARGKNYGVDLVMQLQHVLNFLCDDHIGNTLLCALTAPWEQQRTWQPWGAEGEVGLRQMILLSVLIEYVCCIQDVSQFDEAPFTTWMRFAHNMVQNTDVNQVKNQITLMRLLNEALHFKPDGKPQFNAWEHPYEAIIAFNASRRDNRYLNAEALKANCILKDPHWEAAFRKAEADVFMQGSVTFYYEEDMALSVYENRTANVPQVFNKDGVVDELAKDYLLVRAVLCRNYDWTGIRKNATNFNITNRSADRHLRNLTIWNTNKEVKQLFCSLLDCTDSKQRIALLTNVAENVTEMKHVIQLKPGEWTAIAQKRLQKLYDRLHSEKEMKALQWLYSHDKIRMMGVYIHGDGNGALYKGSVNCMSLTSERHKVIPDIVAKYQGLFMFQYADDRQTDSLNRFGNFSGSNIVLYSQAQLSSGARLKLKFLEYGSLCIDVFGADKAKELFDAYCKMRGTNNIHDQNGKDIYADGSLNSYKERGEDCYHVNYIDDACSLLIADIYKLIDEAYRVLQ